jgi:nitroimidazol reductase NimA-like FMN-containing flavoprotein (pyridoxamine 5'-phosphate oxidase superfamily)
MERLSDDDIVTVLTENGIGVLALAGPEGASPYPIPVAYGYDPETDTLGVQLEGDDESRKHQCLDRSRAAGLTVYEHHEGERIWRSVIVEGELVATSYDAAEPAFAALAKNTQFAPNPLLWGDSETVTPFEFRIDTWSGREFDV